MYRFRPIDKLLNEPYEELKNQEIYFADFKELNDAMEGFRKFVWQGDSIIWTNFLKHYIRCLYFAFMQVSITGLEEKYVEIPLHVQHATNSMTPLEIEDINQIYQLFFNVQGMSELIDFISNRKVEIDEKELFYYLKTIHMIAFRSVEAVDMLNNTQNMTTENFSVNIDPSFVIRDLTETLNKINSFPNYEEIIYEILEEGADISKSEYLNTLYTRYKEIGSKVNGLNFLIYDYTKRYLNEIKSLTTPHMYVSCFMEECENAAVWGYYGGSYHGVCMKFRPEENGILPLQGITGFTIDTETKTTDYNLETTNMKFEKIIYDNNYIKVDFFNAIGQLPVPVLQQDWYRDSNGNISKCGLHLEDPALKEEWRIKQHQIISNGYIRKLHDWNHEKEYRILLPDLLDMHVEIPKRKFKYNFENLEAIIFGMSTTIENRLKIIKIIEDKCKENNRTNFDFYEAEYSPETGRMIKVKLKIDLFNE